MNSLIVLLYWRGVAEIHYDPRFLNKHGHYILHWNQWTNRRISSCTSTGLMV